MLIRFDGEGAVCTSTMSYRNAERWAGGRRPSGMPRRDRTMMFARLNEVVSRRGSSLFPTVGNRRSLRDLKAAMKAAGIEVRDWSFPADLDTAPASKDDEVIGEAPVQAGEEEQDDAPAAGDEADPAPG